MLWKFNSTRKVFPFKFSSRPRSPLFSCHSDIPRLRKDFSLFFRIFLLKFLTSCWANQFIYGTDDEDSLFASAACCCRILFLFRCFSAFALENNIPRPEEIFRFLSEMLNGWFIVFPSSSCTFYYNDECDVSFDMRALPQPNKIKEQEATKMFRFDTTAYIPRALRFLGSTEGVEICFMGSMHEI